MADKNKNVNIEFPDQKIVPINMEKEVRKSFIEYSMSVIVSRALPDARDGMKPGQRRILYAMYEDNLTSDRPFRKSATTVGNVLGRYHPHGDTAVYYTMVRMAQPFSYRYPLVEGHGNFGSVDGDGPAAYRYTEARMSKIANELMRDIEKDVVGWDMNFDNTRREPKVLPSRFPNLLVNGAVGIAVGMATNIPPHNLGEVIDGTIYLMDHPDAGITDLMQFIKGPDFPTGAKIYGTSGILEAYSTGKGRIMVRATAELDEEHHRIIFTDIPYAVQKEELIKSMVQQFREKRIEGVTDMRDESGRAGLRIVVDCRRDANLQIILNQFYKYTELQSTCAVNMLTLVNGEPKILNLRQILNVYIRHQEEVIENRVRFDLNKAVHEAHIFEGYKTAIDHIDEVISIIRASADTPSARENLRARFDLSEEQAQAIVAMTLGRLSGLERQKIEVRLSELYASIEEFKAILADENRIRDIIKTEMLEIKARFADERKTSIETVENEILLEDLIERHRAVITLTHAGYIKRQPSSVYSAQKRGGKGIIGMATKEEDYIERVVVSDSHANLMLFTTRGRVHVLKAYRLPEASRTSKGSNLINLIEIDPGEQITAMLSVAEFPTGTVSGNSVEKEGTVSESDSPEGAGYLVMVTRRGVIKRTALSEFVIQRRGGKIALNLDEGDELIFVARTYGKSDVLIATRNGLSVRFDENQVSVLGRAARGVKGISLRPGDEVAGACVMEKDEMWRKTHSLLCVTEGGYGKRLSLDSIDAKNRGIFGVICQRVNQRTGLLCGVAVVEPESDLLMITNDGTVIRTPAGEIPQYGRDAAGVIVMRIAEGSRLVNFAVTDPEDPVETEESKTDAMESDALEKDVSETDDDSVDEVVVEPIE